MSPAPDKTSLDMPAWISGWVRTTFQMRASSRMPWKKPWTVPLEFIAVARPACCRLAD
jgi:hypothetical protein